MVPAGIEVEITGFDVLGSREDSVAPAARRPGRADPGATPTEGVVGFTAGRSGAVGFVVDTGGILAEEGRRGGTARAAGEGVGGWCVAGVGVGLGVAGE